MTNSFSFIRALKAVGVATLAVLTPDRVAAERDGYSRAEGRSNASNAPSPLKAPAYVRCVADDHRSNFSCQNLALASQEQCFDRALVEGLFAVPRPKWEEIVRRKMCPSTHIGPLEMANADISHNIAGILNSIEQTEHAIIQKEAVLDSMLYVILHYAAAVYEMKALLAGMIEFRDLMEQWDHSHIFERNQGVVDELARIREFTSDKVVVLMGCGHFFWDNRLSGACDELLIDPACSEPYYWKAKQLVVNSIIEELQSSNPSAKKVKILWERMKALRERA